MTLQPVLNFGVRVRGIVVDDQMQIEFWRRFRIDLLQELNPFLMPMPRHAFGNNFPFAQFNGSKQCCGPIAFVVVCQCLQSSWEKWKALLCSVEFLNLAFLVAGKHQSMFRGIEVKPDHINKLLRKSGIVRNFERLDAMWFQTIVRPDSLNRVFADTDSTGHSANGPLCEFGGFS